MTFHTKIKTSIILTIIFIFMLFSSFSASAEQMKVIGPYEAHYIALNSTFITPQIAKAYGIERSRYKGFVNISVLKKAGKNKQAQHVTLSGTAKNLLGSIIDLEFRKIVEGDAIYYIASIDYRNEETFKFNIKVNDGNRDYTLKFDQKFYVD